MQEVKTVNKQPIAFLTIAAIILIAFGIIGYADSETKQFAELFAAENILGLAVYFLPTLLVCILLYRRYKKKSSMAVSIAKAVIFGIPLCFVLVIVILVTLKKVGVV
jgi:hypothetical protein